VVGRLQDLHSSFGDLWKTFMGKKDGSQVVDVVLFFIFWCGG